MKGNGEKRTTGNRWGNLLQFFEKNYHEVINSVLVIYQKYGSQLQYSQWFQNQFKFLQYNLFPTRSFLSSTPHSSYSPHVANATGLENLGNTCFLNAMLQALASLPSIRNYVDIISSYDEESHKLTFIRKLSKCFKGK
jgi:ubiquitin C-terminal hydrolase